MTNQTLNHRIANARGPYHGEGRMPSAPTSFELETRYKSTHDTNYSEQYQMPVGGLFHGNNGPQGVL
jgi:hypothetical protein